MDATRRAFLAVMLTTVAVGRYRLPPDVLTTQSGTILLSENGDVLLAG